MLYIFTICYNDLNNLSKTVASVRKFKKNFMKFIVIDGDSSDGTRLFIESNLDIIDHYISEPDKGIYDAMNKATLFGSDEDHFFWLNAGDILLETSHEMEKLLGHDVIYTAVMTSSGYSSIKKIKVPQLYPVLNAWTVMPRSIFRHQGFFLRKHIFKKYLYDTSVGLQADGLLMSLCQKNEKWITTSLAVANFNLDGISNTDNWSIIKSYVKVIKRLNLNPLLVTVYQSPYLLKTFIKIVLPEKIVKLIIRLKAIF